MLLILSTFILYLLYYIATRKNNYWKNKNVPHLKPKFIIGNYGDLFLFKKTLGITVHDICKHFPDAPMMGAYYGTEPMLIPKDPELIKLITVKDFYYFHGRALTDYTHKDPRLLNLFSTHGDTWKTLRQNLTPLFSSKKMKNMFHLIQIRLNTLEELLEKEIGDCGTIDIKSILVRFMIESIGACAFGVDTRTMTDDDNNPFAIAGRIMVPVSKISALKKNIRLIWPGIYFRLRLRMNSNNFSVISKIVAAVFEQRKNEPSSRNDFVDLLLKWKANNFITGDRLGSTSGQETKTVIEVSNNLLLAQSMVFFIAGFETSAAVSCFTLYELAKNKRALKKALEDVDEYLLRHENQITYDCISELPYLEACIDEALRLYPGAGVMAREVMKDYTLPNGVFLEKGLRIHIPVYHLHRNPKYFPVPEQYRPERFYGKEKHKITPYTYMPFGEGPRICIGLRFAKMQILACLATILKTYTVELDKDTPSEINFIPETDFSIPKLPLKIKFVKREGYQSL